MNYDLDEIGEPYSTEQKFEHGKDYVENHLQNKLEKEGSKIRFLKHVTALYHYMRDKNVSWYRKSFVVGALIYFISPIDTIPDFVPIIGYLDDLGVIMLVLKFLGSELIPYYD